MGGSKSEGGVSDSALHVYVGHGLGWSPVKWLSLAANYATYERDPGGGVERKRDDGSFGLLSRAGAAVLRLAAQVWLWGPKSGMMGGSLGSSGTRRYAAEGGVVSVSLTPGEVG